MNVLELDAQDVFWRVPSCTAALALHSVNVGFDNDTRLVMLDFSPGAIFRQCDPLDAATCIVARWL